MSTTPDNPPALKPVETWQGSHRAIRFEIKHRAENSEHFNRPTGSWTYYVYIQEKDSPRFEEIWLADKLSRYSPESPERCSQDYYNSPLASVEMHGGITFYQKHGHSVGHRCVEIGCDYQHLWDEGVCYNAEECAYDARKTIDDLFERGLLRARATPPADARRETT